MKSFHRRLLAILFTGLVAITGCYRNSRQIVQQEAQGSLTVMFYNVENLFDTVDDPDTRDEDFTPGGRYAWTEERLSAKLNRLEEVIVKGGGLPAVLGLCEVENREVLERLIRQPGLNRFPYSIVHRDSPDLRGIDVAFLYRTDELEVIHSQWKTVRISNPSNSRTRDILYVKGNAQGLPIHFFVNHWPSRSGGQEASAPWRAEAAGVLRAAIDSILQTDARASILCMGDFNDHPMDASVRDVLGANTESKFLFNLMEEPSRRGEGSHWYRGEWGMLDQIIVSPALISGAEGWRVSSEGARVIRDVFLLFTDKDGMSRPNRTYAGDKYIGGYSDHLPVVVKLVR